MNFATISAPVLEYFTGFFLAGGGSDSTTCLLDLMMVKTGETNPSFSASTGPRLVDKKTSP